MVVYNGDPAGAGVAGGVLPIQHVNAGSNKNEFSLNGYTAFATVTGSGSPYPTVTAGAFNLLTDAAGDLAFNLGATLNTTSASQADGTGTPVVAGSTEPYADGLYQASLYVSVNY
jgi:hypothetical protein